MGTDRAKRAARQRDARGIVGMALRSATRAARHARFTAGSWLLALSIIAGASGIALADDGSMAMRDLASSGDFRVRVNAALVLGRVKPEGALGALEHGLSDAHPAVRAASAEALGALGDSSALPVLAQRSAIETSTSVKAQIRVAMDSVRGGAAEAQTDTGHTPPSEVRYMIALGSMHNATGVRGDELRQVLSNAARERSLAMPGAAVVDDAHEARDHKAAARRHIPVITLDGNLSQMVESNVNGSVQVHVRVDFTVRRDQTLKGTVSGAATTFGAPATMTPEARERLQDDAVEGAVQSALRGAEQGLIVAAR